MSDHGQCSSMMAETKGVGEAIKWLMERGERGLILTDSKCLVQKIGGGVIPQEWRHMIQQMKVLHIAFIPGHAGISMNEFVDRRASGKLREGQGKRAADQAETEGPADKHGNSTGSWSLARIQEELGCAKGEGAQKSWERTHKRRMNQATLGRPSFDTIQWILSFPDWRKEHLG